MLDKKVSRRTSPAPVNGGVSKLREWIPIILTTLALGAGASAFVFKTNIAAEADHRLIEKRVDGNETINALQAQEAVYQKEKLDEALRTFNRNLRRLVPRHSSPDFEDIPE